MSGAEILFLAHRMPFPPNRGDKIRSHHILQRLSRIAPVHVACFADDDDDMAEEVELAALAHSYRLVRRGKALALAGVQALAQRCPVSLTAFYDPQIDAYVKELLASGKIGTIYVFSGQMGQYVPDSFAGRVIVDFVDVDSAKFEAYATRRGGLMRWIDAREARLLHREEERLAKRADVSLLISHREAELFVSRLSPEAARRADVRVLGNGIDSNFFDPAHVRAEPRIATLSGGPRLVFTGQMDYPPNIAAVIRVTQSIMPQVLQTMPEASFHIVGRNPTADVLALDGVNGARVWGRVEDIRPWLRAADMAVAPLDIARGVQNKVLEAMAMALPVVLTDAAATGINAVPGHHFWVAESDADLATAIVRLAADTRRAWSMGVAARRYVVEQQSWQSALAKLVEVVSPPVAHSRNAA